MSILSFHASAITVNVTSDSDRKSASAPKTFKIFVSNTDNVTRDNVIVTTNVPASMTFYQYSSRPLSTNCNSSCGSGSSIQWELGDIAAGQTKVIYAHYFIGSSATEGLLTHSTSVTYDGISSAIVKEYELSIDFSASAAISVAAKSQQVLAGGNIEFELSYGNIGDSGWVSTELSASLPAGTTFVSASDGGTVVGNDIVWGAGVSNAGTSGKRFYTVKANNSASVATLYESKVTVGNNGTELASANESVVVKADANLTLDVTITGDTRTPSQYSYYRYVVANKGGVSLTDVTLNVLIGAGSEFSQYETLPNLSGCSNNCDAYEWANLNIGQLDAGESRVLVVQVYSRNPVDGAPLISYAMVTENSGNYTVGAKPTVLYDSSDNLMLSMTSNKQVVDAGEVHRYELSYGNISGSAVQNLELEMALPEDVTFVKASDGGSLADGIVTWPLGTLNSGNSGKRYVTVAASDALGDGNVLVSEALLNTGGPSLVRASESVVIKSGVDLTLDVTITGDTRTPSQYSYYRYVVANKGGLSLTDVTLNVLIGAGSEFSPYETLPNLSGCTNNCDPYEVATLAIGQLDAGESRVLLVQVYSDNPVDGAPLISHAMVTESSGNYSVGTKPTVLYDSSVNLMLSMTSNKQVVDAGEVHRYELSYGNISGSAVQNLELEMALPEDVTFVKASDGGSLADGIVTWSLGTLNSGNSGKRYVTVAASDALGDGNVLVSEALLNTGGPSLVRASESVVIKSGVDLTLDVTITGDTRTPSQYSYYRYVVANKGGLSLTDVTLNVLIGAGSEFSPYETLPNLSGCTNNCDPYEVATLAIGQLDAGESRVLLVQVYSDNPVDGAPLISHAMVTESSGNYSVGTKPTVLYDSSVNLMLSMTSNKQVVDAGEVHRYELSYGNISGSAVQNLELEMALPEDVTFVKASDGGSLADGIVTWSLGTLNSGNSGKRYVTVAASDALGDGNVLVSEALLNTGGPSLVRASESVVIKSGVDLTLDVTITGDFRPNTDYVYYRYVVANKGGVSFTDVKLNVLGGAGSEFSPSKALPNLSGCTNNCDPYEVATLAIGQLDAGESRVLLVPVYSKNPVAGAPWITHVSVTENSGSFTLGTKPTASYGVLGVTNNPQLVVEADTFLVAPNQEQTFSLNLGNVTGAALKNSLLSVTIPDGYQFVSASGQTVIKGKQIFWPIGNLGNNFWVNETVVLRVDSGLSDAEVLVLEGELRNGDDNELVARSSVSSVVQSALGLTLDVTGGFVSPLSAGDTINMGLNIINNDNVQLADIDLNVMVPINTSANEASAGADGCSGSTCEVFEWANWDIGNLDPTQSSVNSISPQLRTGSYAPLNGSILTSNILMTQGSLPKSDNALIRSWGVGAEFAVNTDHDSDGDLIPDWWEIKFGLNRLNVADGLLDGDSDQLNNVEEYQAGTDPTNEDSDGDGIIDGNDEAPLTFNNTAPQPPVITSIETEDGALLVRFSANGDGGSSIIDYTVTCGGNSVTSAQSPIRILELENDVSYACSVTARNILGNSLASVSVSGTPEGIIRSGLNIPLLKAILDAQSAAQ